MHNSRPHEPRRSLLKSKPGRLALYARARSRLRSFGSSVRKQSQTLEKIIIYMGFIYPVYHSS